MKNLLFIIFTLIIIAAFIGCTGKGTGKKDLQTTADTATVPDTGRTGIVQYMSGQYKISEVTFKNGIRDGLMKSFYQGGQVRTTFWYVNGLKQDSARWYFETGELFRTTPYKNDTVDGIQKQFYRTGKVRAKIGWSRGLRTPFIQEFGADGKLMGGYPSIVANISDEYNSKGSFRINLELSDKSKNVTFYLGDFSDGRLDTAACKLLSKDTGKAEVILKKGGTPGPGAVNVIAYILTPLKNRHITSKQFNLPYRDLH